MSEPTLGEQADLLKRELDLRRRVYPSKIKMGQLTEEAARRHLLTLEAAIKTISTPITFNETSRYLEIEPTLHHVYRCANEHRAGCPHCLAVAMLMEDSLGFVRDKPHK